MPPSKSKKLMFLGQKVHVLSSFMCNSLFGSVRLWWQLMRLLNIIMRTLLRTRDLRWECGSSGLIKGWAIQSSQTKEFKKTTLCCRSNTLGRISTWGVVICFSSFNICFYYFSIVWFCTCYKFQVNIHWSVNLKPKM